MCCKVRVHVDKSAPRRFRFVFCYDFCRRQNLMYPHKHYTFFTTLTISQPLPAEVLIRLREHFSTAWSPNCSRKICRRQTGVLGPQVCKLRIVQDLTVWQSTARVNSIDWRTSGCYDVDLSPPKLPETRLLTAVPQWLNSAFITTASKVPETDVLKSSLRTRLCCGRDRQTPAPPCKPPTNNITNCPPHTRKTTKYFVCIPYKARTLFELQQPYRLMIGIMEWKPRPRLADRARHRLERWSRAHIERYVLTALHILTLE